MRVLLLSVRRRRRHPPFRNRQCIGGLRSVPEPGRTRSDARRHPPLRGGGAIHRRWRAGVRLQQVGVGAWGLLVALPRVARPSGQRTLSSSLPSVSFRPGLSRGSANHRLEFAQALLSLDEFGDVMGDALCHETSGLRSPTWIDAIARLADLCCQCIGKRCDESFQEGGHSRASPFTSQILPSEQRQGQCAPRGKAGGGEYRDGLL